MKRETKASSLSDKKAVIATLNKHIEHHDESRKLLQKDLHTLCEKLNNQAEELKRKLSGDLEAKFEEENSKIQNALYAIQTVPGVNSEGEESDSRAIDFSVSVKWSCSIKKVKNANILQSVTLTNDHTEIECVNCSSKDYLNKILMEYDENRQEAQESIHRSCDEIADKVQEFGEIINKKLEKVFVQEDGRLQKILHSVCECDENSEDLQNILEKAKYGLLIKQSYSIEKISDHDIDVAKVYDLKIKKEADVEWLEIKEVKNLKFIDVKAGKVCVEFDRNNSEEEKIFSASRLDDTIRYVAQVTKKGETEWRAYALKKDLAINTYSFIPDTVEENTAYSIKISTECDGKESKMSSDIEFTMPNFSVCCTWKNCFDNANKTKKYIVDEINSRWIRGVHGNDLYSTVIGNTLLPLNKITSWTIKNMEAIRFNPQKDIYVGVAPFDIGQNEKDNYIKCGWYLDCYDSTLWSGPPHNYKCKEYGPKYIYGKYAHTGDSVGIVMDAEKGELSFVVNGVNYGVAYKRIPLDKPLVLCAILNDKGSVELDTSEVKDNVNSSIPVPSNITAKSEIWDSITLSWDAVKGASFYQIEVDGSAQQLITTNTFTKRGFPMESKCSFRVRAVCRNEVSEWSDDIESKTKQVLDVSESAWNKCPTYVENKKAYSLSEGSLTATKTHSNCWCTVIGNGFISANKVVSWNVKILKSRDNNGNYIYVGVAPFDIDQNRDDNFNACGWLLDCYDSKLRSGPPHNFRGKKYGPRKEDGEYIHTGDSVGVVMDTTKGELSFVVSGVNLGVAYDGIPLDKPLVPCAILMYEGDSVMLVLFDKENCIIC